MKKRIRRALRYCCIACVVTVAVSILWIVLVCCLDHAITGNWNIGFKFLIETIENIFFFYGGAAACLGSLIYLITGPGEKLEYGFVSYFGTMMLYAFAHASWAVALLVSVLICVAIHCITKK